MSKQNNTVYGKIIKSSEYRDSYKESPANPKFRRVQFDIASINYKDCITISNQQDGTKERHPRVSWEPMRVSIKKQKTKAFKRFYFHWENDILEEYFDEDGNLIICWMDSYIPESSIIKQYM